MMTVSFYNSTVYHFSNNNIKIIYVFKNFSAFRIGFENTSYIVCEGIGFLEVCVRLFEPPEESSIGRLTVNLGVETVQGTAGIMCRDAVTTLSIAFFLIYRWK